MRISPRRTATGLGGVALTAALMGAMAAPASADDLYQDAKVVCAGGAAQVCAHVQYTNDPKTPQVRAVGTAAGNQRVTIVKVTLVERIAYWPLGHGTTKQIAETSQVTDSGGQLSAITAHADKEFGFYKVAVYYDTNVDYRIGDGAVSTVTATDNPVLDS